MTDPSASPIKRCAAGVTVYKPDEAILLRLLKVLRDDGIPTVVHVDGPTGEAASEALAGKLAANANLVVLRSPHNGGIGAALNRLAAAAIEGGYHRILFLDQDSDLPTGMAAELSAGLDAAEARGRPVAAIGPRPVAPAGEAIQPPRYRRTDRTGSAATVAVDFLITSGSLVSLDAWQAVGPFREDYFMDAIDVEWCFRARDRGYDVLVDDVLKLPHRVGAGIVRIGPLSFPQQSEARMSSYVRNQAHMLRLRHVPVRWKLRTLLYVPLQIGAYCLHGRSGNRFKRMAASALDGLRGRFTSSRNSG